MTAPLPGWPRLVTVMIARTVLTALGGLLLWATLPLLAGCSVDVVMSGSMAPALRVGDVVVVRPSAGRAPQPGQVVSVRDAGHGGRLLLHRVLLVGEDGVVTTKGDANAGADSTPAQPQSVVGVAVLRIPVIGHLALWARTGRAGFTAAALVILLLLGRLACTPVDGPARPWPGRRRRSRTAVVTLGVGAVLLVALPHAGPGPAWSAYSASTANGASTLSAAATFPGYSEAVLADTPSAYYRSNDANGSTTAADSSGNSRTGSYLGVAASYQQPGSPAGGSSTLDTAVLFPGTGGATANSGTTWTNPNPFTIEVWVKSSSSSASRFFGFGEYSSGNSFYTDRYLTLASNGRISFFVGSTTINSAATGYNDGQWHRVAASLGAAGMKLYVDGAAVVTNAGITTGQNYTGYWRLGGDNGYLTGSLDEAAVYPTQLSDTRVGAHRTAGLSATTLADYTSSVTADSPWGFWHLDDAPAPPYRGASFGLVMADSSGLSHPGNYAYLRPQDVVAGGTGALVASQATTSVRFGGSGIGYDPVSVANPTTFSLELWFRTTSSTGGKLIGFGNSASGSSSQYDRQIYLTNSGQLVFGIWTGAVSAVTSAGTYRDGGWHHVVGALGTGALTLYVDGATAGTVSSPGTPQNYTGYWRWGGDSLGGGWPSQPSGDYVVGDLDEVAIYPTELTAQQVAVHYHANH